MSIAASGRVGAALRARTPQQEEEETTRFNALEEKEQGQAQKIVKELYFRYEKQLQRWRDYRTLFAFLFFVAWFLATLYLQRSANVEYMVHSTLDDVLHPGTNVMQSTSEVYDWLGNTLQAVWVDPVCGDGICESPWEFASYSRFGCRADCGKLPDVQNLTQIQVDLNWNFANPLASTPTADLMQNAYWNLCPHAGVFSSQCYYASDNSFSSITGSASFVIEDAPDGLWTIDVKNDIFNKIGGAVRSTALVNQAAYYVKNYVAAASALAEMDLEERLLQAAVATANLSLFEFIQSELAGNATLNANFTYGGYLAPNAPVTDQANQLQQIKNATCACITVQNTTSSTVYNNLAFRALNSSYDPVDHSLGMFSVTSTGTYQAGYCPTLTGSGSPVLYDWVDHNTTLPNTTIVTTWTWQPTTDMPGTCLKVLGNALKWQQAMMRRLQNQVLDWRVGDLSRTGSIVARNAVFQQLQTYVLNSASEFFIPVFSAPYGTDPMNKATAKVDALQKYYVASPLFFTSPMPLANAITKSAVTSPTVKADAIAVLATNRLAELAAQRAATLAVTIPPISTKYSTKTVGQLVAQFLAAGATSPLSWYSTNPDVTCTLPDMNSTALGDLRTEYNFVVWSGNSTAYMQCDLETRGPEYLGKCVPVGVTCTASGDATFPYNCVDSNGAVTPSSTPYTVSNAQYRSDCELPCDRQADCNAICECWGNCRDTEACVCKACSDMLYDARNETDFAAIQDVTGLGASAYVIIPYTNPPTGSPLLGRRRLQQDLTTVLNSITAVQTQQVQLQAQTAALQAAVDQANVLAQAQARDPTLINLIDQGRQDISNNQAAILSKLEMIIGKQDQSLAAAQKASVALSSIQNLAAQQQAAQQQLATNAQSKITAIKSAANSNLITLQVALALYKKTRRDIAAAAKQAKLATQACTSAPVTSNNFTLDNGYAETTKTPRERNVGLNNRVIAGMLLYQTRTNDTNCTDSKFNLIQQTCTGPRTNLPFGVDPIFRRGSSLYLPDYDDVNHTIVTRFYNCSQLKNPTYGVTVLNQTVNLFPYCAELYNPRSEPYSFYSFPLRGKPEGFPVFFDINLGAEGAMTWQTYLTEGLFLDQHTESLSVEMITYNAPLRIFGYVNINFKFSTGGSILVSYRLDTVRVELYNSYSDSVRLFMEIVLNIMVFGMLLYTFYKIIRTQIERRNFLKFFLSAWNVIDFCSNGLLAACCIMWWIFVTDHANLFNVDLRYDVYASIEPAANYLALMKNGTALTNAWDAYDSLNSLVNMVNWYFALNGINILLLIARMLRLMDFQPRLGVVTRSLWLAGPDLLHFGIVAGMVFVGYAMMGHLIFGNVIENFATFGESVNTCFEMLLGDISVNDKLRALDGLLAVAGALFFWSYELLVFMVLLNFLLAIIVDAFSEVKEKTEETVGIHTELVMMAKDRWRSMLGLCSANYISDSKLGYLLQQWAGEDKVDAAKGEVETVKLLTVLNEDMDEEDLKTVLLECLKDAPGMDDDDEKAKGQSKAAALVRRVFCLPSGRTVTATPREIELAAKYIVERFGVKTEQEMEAEPDEDGVVKPAHMHRTNPLALEQYGGEAGMGDKEREQLGSALERLADVQRELADGQRNLMVGQRQLAEQQSKLIALMSADE